MPKPEPSMTGLEILSPDDALQKLFEANQACERSDRAVSELKAENKSLHEYRGALLHYIDEYAIHRKAQIARGELLDESFRKEPMPPWLPGIDPDKRGDE